MPIYEYQCQNCFYELEKMQKISDPPLTRCPACGKDTLQKAISAPSFRLSGSGWYETDFKNDKEKKRNLTDSENKAEKKSENTPETETSLQAKLRQPKQHLKLNQVSLAHDPTKFTQPLL